MAASRKKLECENGMSLDCIPDDAIISILSKLGDARLIARCATLNRRWRRLRWFVSRLCFRYKANDISLLAKAEEIIFSVLQSIRQKGGHLREFQVVLDYTRYTEEEFRASTDWLVLVDTLESLRLEALGNVSWDSDLWRNIACFDKLSELHVVGRQAHPNPYGIRRLNDFSALKRLRACAIFPGWFKGICVTKATLESIVATCPSLERLSVSYFVDSSSLRIASNSLKHLYLTGPVPTDLKLTLETPDLMFLSIDHIRAVEIGAQALHHMELNCPCNFTVRENRLEKLAFLSMRGSSWSVDNLVQITRLATVVEDLRLSISVEAGDIGLGAFLQPLTRLKRISFGSYTLKCFTRNLNETDLHTLGAFTVYVQLSLSILRDQTNGSLEVLKALVRNCSALQSLHIDCSCFGAFPCLRSGRATSNANDWYMGLLELQAFSNRVKLSFVFAPEKQQLQWFGF